MSRYAKAVTAFFTALGTWGVTAFADDALTSVEMFGLCGVVVTVASVFAIPNTPLAGEARDPNISETVPELPYDPEHTTRDRGAVDWRTVALVALAAVAVLWALSLVPAEVAI